MKAKRLIRTKNTLLAAFGAVLLTAELVFAALMGEVLISASWLVLSLLGFWLVNVVIIVSVASGYSERYKDASLSEAQMYWASSCCVASLLLMPKYSLLVYFLFYLIAIFGVFRLRARAFSIYATVQCVLVAGALYTQYTQGLTDQLLIELMMTWFVLTASMLILSMLCRSIAILREKLRTKNAELEDALAARSQFLANMSHEIRTPMNGVLGMLELVSRDGLSRSQKKYLDVARSSGQSLVALINDVLDYSKIEAGKLDLDEAGFDLKTTLRRLCQSFYFMAFNKGVDLIVDIDPAIADKILSDEIRVRQIFNNLLGNAIKFTTQGEVVLSVLLGEKKPGYCRLDCFVQDTGEGIAEDALDAIFESFSQADNTTTRKFGGTGLGLAIARKLCQLLGGDIHVESVLGEGSRFSFSLNVKCSDLPPQIPGSLDGELILVIDDNLQRASALIRAIEFLGGAAVKLDNFSLRLDDILEKVIADSFSGVIVQRNLADQEGLPLINRLTTLPGFTGLKLVLATHDFDIVGVQKFAILEEPITLDGVYKTIADNKAIDTQEFGAVDPHAEKSKKDAHMSLPRVLLVEDNKTNQEVAMMLLEDCDVDVDVADDGQMALQQLKDATEPYVMVFMDCQMPNMDGYDATRAIRAGEAGESYQAIPIIAMTANALAGDKEKCLAAGMSDYISKPVSFEIIEEKVQQWSTLD